MQRRNFLFSSAGLLAGSFMGKARALSPEAFSQARIAAAWRGASPDAPYFAGVLLARWDAAKVQISHSLRLPGRPHGLLPEPDGQILVVGARPARWMLRWNPQTGAVTALDTAEEGALKRLNGHVIRSLDGRSLYTTETDFTTGRGRIGVRDAQTLQKRDEWDSHGLEPHQLLSDAQGHIFVANGGIPRSLEDKKLNLAQMDSSLVKLDGQSGARLQQWKLDDARLSLRHLAWSYRASTDTRYLGIALQAEHHTAAERAQAPFLAVLSDKDDALITPTRRNDGTGYAGDIAAAHHGGFMLSSNTVGKALLWHPGIPDQLNVAVEMQQAYALSSWHGPDAGGGMLIATAPGLVRWHPTAPPAFLAWPEPMALDNHWALMDEA